MVQQQQKSPSSILFESYGSYGPEGLSTEKAGQLMKYCCGIIYHPETNSPERHQKAKDILIGQSCHASNLLVGMLNDAQHLAVIVDEIIAEAIRRNPDGQFIDTLARNAAAAMANQSQREGATRVLMLEPLCGIALKYVAASLKSNELYIVVSDFFKKAAEKEQHRQDVLGVLRWAMKQQGLAINAAFILNSLADKYGLSIGTQADVQPAS